MTELSKQSKNVVFEVDNVSKKFCRNLKRSMLYGLKDLCYNALGKKGCYTQLRKDEFWAIRNVSFSVNQGEFFGIIGSNGAGKSTLLRMISGVFPIDEGQIISRGRVGALIALGAGFHPHLSGKENIYLNGAILGMSHEYVKENFKSIIDFAEIGDFIHAPISTYSSGMRVRLGFSVAVHMQPDILLVDEVLSVGDSSFRERSYKHMLDYKKRGGSVIFISHNSQAVESICDRVMWLDQGKIQMIGNPADTVRSYEGHMQEVSLQSKKSSLKLEKISQQDGISISEVSCHNLEGNQQEKFEFNDSFVVRIRYQIVNNFETPNFVIYIKKSGFEGGSVAVISSFLDNVGWGNISGSGVASCLIERPSLSPGLYSFSIGIQSKPSGNFGEKWHLAPKELHYTTITPGKLKSEIPNALAVNLVSNLAPVVLEHSWSIEGSP